MSAIETIAASSWELADQPADARDRMLTLVEQGGVLHLPGLHRPIEWSRHAAVLDPKLADPARKNISFDPASQALHGALGDAAAQRSMCELLASYQEHALRLIHALAPQYGAAALRVAPASLRLFQVEGRPGSWRKDDSRLHIDAFPSRPNRGERILRVFHNLNPHGVARVWRVGEPFAAAAHRFARQVPRYSVLAASALRALRVTKSVRSEYDHVMLHLHDAMKRDVQYQAACPQQRVAFGPGSTWVCFSDQTSHAVMSGQFMLEQTLHLPVASMRDPAQSPLRVLEALYGRALA